jgi:glycosyltransferase involved in cell wall biosynthesis
MDLALLADRLFISLSWLLALAWLWKAIDALRGIPQIPDLTRIDASSLPALPDREGPHLAVVVPACNEEVSIQATLRSLLASTGLRLEIVAVNDRSTDRTGALIEEVAAEAAFSGSSHRLIAIHVSELPECWLGKPHAMARGAEMASAPWLLFTDADVIFHPDALALSLRHAMARNADHMILVPTLAIETNGEAAVLAAMNILGQWTIRLWKVSDPKAGDFFGSGSFNLIRRGVYTRLGGFAALRLEVVEDLALGQLVKHARYAQHAAVGPGLIRIRWLQGTFGIVHLAEKNAFAFYRYRVGLTLLACLGIASLAVLPLAALMAGGWATAAGLVTYASILLAYAANRRISGVPPWLAVLFAPAAAIVLFALLRSMVLALARKGVEWRGTRYPLEELRQYARRNR